MPVCTKCGMPLLEDETFYFTPEKRFIRRKKDKLPFCPKCLFKAFDALKAKWAREGNYQKVEALKAIERQMRDEVERG